MMALVGNENFCMIEMETIWNVVESCIQQTMIYSGEAWDMTAKNFKEINEIQDSIIKRILKYTTARMNRFVWSSYYTL